MHDLEHVDPKSLKAWPGNPRQNAKAVDAVAKSIKRFGFGAPIVANRREGEREIIAGHTRQLAALRLKLPLVPVRWLDLDPNEAHALALADNKMVEIAAWDDAALARVMAEVKAYDAHALEGLGWDDGALARIMDDAKAKDVEDPGATDPPTNAKSKRGEIYEIGPHRLMCGDSRDPATWDALCAGRRIAVAFTSPPYAEQRTYDENSGFRPIPPDEYVEWFAPVAAGVASHLATDGSWFVNIKPSCDDLDTETYVLDLVLAHVRRWGWHFATEFCWERSGVPKSVTQRFKNGFEPIYQFARGRWKMRPDAVRHESANVPRALGKGAGNTAWDGSGGVMTQGTRGGALGTMDFRRRNGGTSKRMSEVQCQNAAPGEMVGPGLAYPSNRLPTFSSTHEALGHAAAFPVGLADFFVKAFSDPGDIICDPFCGSGSTLIAAAQNKRVGLGIELSPAYCDVIRMRWTKWARAAGVDPGPGALDA